MYQKPPHDHNVPGLLCFFPYIKINGTFDITINIQGKLALQISKLLQLCGIQKWYSHKCIERKRVKSLPLNIKRTTQRFKTWVTDHLNIQLNDINRQ